ncbi:DUF1002 domain-containing protein [Peptoniphilus sp. MSJ-1]|uniref:DUF1002 domain-containing protein n=1 Tax=Peptoniphilus ovalis TaxID=2841503 RepID=A0ABS6FEI0_9FIRM|nr:DUF1002 domain-containing protein [Peptoniphilus ovalis]MBU5668575.1 DUF1002 domain-containing protein [Peptoniphilus ovalis]
MRFKNKVAAVLLAATLIPSAVFAKGSTIITLGSDLRESQKSEMLREMNADENTEIIEVTNKEEYQYLGDILTSKEIGNKALSAAKINFKDKGYGLEINLSPNIRIVTAEAIKNALNTVGVEDAEIYVTAPGKVSGTAALTGILKAYEANTGKNLSEDLKKVANEELVVQTKLSEEVGDDKANDIIYQIKDAMAENMPKNESEVRNIIQNVTNNYNINLTESQENKLVSLFNNMKNADVDWNRVADTAKKYKDKAGAFLNSPEGEKAVEDTKNILEKIIDFIVSLFK